MGQEASVISAEQSRVFDEFASNIEKYVAAKSTLQRISVAVEATPHFHQSFLSEVDSMVPDWPYKMSYKIHQGEIIDATIMRSDDLPIFHSLDTEMINLTNSFKDRITLNRIYGDIPIDPERETRRSCEITKVEFSKENCFNVDGTTKDKRQSSWIAFWERVYGEDSTRHCKIAHPNVNKDKKDGLHSSRIVGGHMEKEVLDAFWYILPICQGHNNKKFDRGEKGGVMTTTSDGKAVQIPPMP